jgi:hypothetical protein
MGEDYERLCSFGEALVCAARTRLLMVRRLDGIQEFKQLQRDVFWSSGFRDVGPLANPEDESE